MGGAADTVGVIGVGMVGGSLALALRRAGREVVAYDVAGAGSGVGDCATALDSPAAVCEASDIVVLATPPGRFADCARQIADTLTDDKVLTDVGSVKRMMFDVAREVFGRVPPNLVPGHPIAGSEKSGAAAATEGLFKGATVILTPHADGDAAALEKVRGMWEAVGATAECMDCETHDRIFAEVSHLPHMAAYALVNCLLGGDQKESGGEEPGEEEPGRFIGGGFRDYARLASSNPELWRDIAVANRDHLVKVMRRYADEITGLSDLLERGDGEGVRDYFSRARRARERTREGTRERTREGD